MKISINNFNGISSLDYEIINNKINFLFGISGTGKSSISSALTDKDIDSHQRVGNKVGKVSVTVDGAIPNYDSFNNCIYNSDYMQGILINKSNTEDIYNILIGDRGNIDKCKEDYEDSLKDLLVIKDELKRHIEDIVTIIDKLKIKYTTKNEYYSTCSISKMMDSANSLKKVNKYSKYSSKDLKRISDGTKMNLYQKGKCPFCTKKITNKQRIDKLLIFDAKDYELINSFASNFSNFNVALPDWNKKNEVTKFNQELKDLIEILEDLRKLYVYIDCLDKSYNFNLIKKSNFKLSAKLKKYFPNIYQTIEQFYKNIRDINKKLSLFISATNNVLKDNCKTINDDLSILGIPYLIIKDMFSDEDKAANYTLVHKDLNSKDYHDMASSLSTGEKNIIGLLLFLLSHKKSDFIIIDDPASSFDEYRRLIIFKLIYEYHTNSTVLVLSHDQVFVKYAIIYKNQAELKKIKNENLNSNEKKFIDDLGNVNYIENYDQVEIKQIDINDFKLLDEFVFDRLISGNLGTQMNYIIACNLRLFYELRKIRGKYSYAYSYLSAIIHKTSYNEIVNKDIEEKALIQINKDLMEYNADFNLVYTKLDPDYIDKIDDYNYTSFEKVFRLRENYANKTGKKNKIIFDELSNIIHLNSSYTICLNPYKFNYFSKYVYELIK